jgi:hypothetical protein
MSCLSIYLPIYYKLCSDPCFAVRASLCSCFFCEKTTPMVFFFLVFSCLERAPPVAGPFRAAFRAFRPVCAFYLRRRPKKNAAAPSAAISITRTRDPLCPLKWWCLEIWISNRHPPRPMKSPSSCDCHSDRRSNLEPRVYRAKALGELSRLPCSWSRMQ